MFEAFKQNALVLALIMLGTLILPFGAFGAGYFIAFDEYFSKTYKSSNESCV